MIERFRKLLEVLPASPRKLWLDRASVSQELEAIIIEHWDGLLGGNYTGYTKISESAEELQATRHWAQGSYPLSEEDIEAWLSDIEEVYSIRQTLLEYKNEADE